MPATEIDRSWRIAAPQCSLAEAFALVADIESFADFVPGYRTAHIITRGEDAWLVENVCIIGPVDWRFHTTARFDPRGGKSTVGGFRLELSRVGEDTA